MLVRDPDSGHRQDCVTAGAGTHTGRGRVGNHAGSRELDRGFGLAEEVARFDALAARWWDPDGPMRPLHRMNPAAGRLDRRADRAADIRTRRDARCWMSAAAPASRPRRWPGTASTCSGIDAAGEAIEAARAHAARPGPVR